MILLEHSTYDDRTVAANLGAPEYSYWFVRKAVRPLLQRFGVVVPVADPEHDADRICASARAHGQDCVLFAFNPPQYTPLGLACPVVPVFAWEFDTIPDESWNANPREDWRHVLTTAGVAVTHGEASAEAVRRRMGADFPVWIIPAPLHSRAASRRASAKGWREPTALRLDGAVVVDAGRVDLGLFAGPRSPGTGARALRRLQHAASRADAPAVSLSISGVVYTAVLNPADGRKNWVDLTAGFVRAFHGTPDAVLLLKLTHADLEEAFLPLLEHLGRLGPFACRIVLIHGMLSEAAYGSLVEATSYAVNTSQGEGQCLPLMEFMSAGRPAVAPRHTALLDYVDARDAFVVESHVRPGFWPHDERQAWRCLRHEISFADLVRAFRDSFRVARSDPVRYARMSQAAVDALGAVCSDEVAERRMAQVLAHVTGGRMSPAARLDGVAA